MKTITKVTIGVVATALTAAAIVPVIAQERGGFERGDRGEARMIRAHQRGGGERAGRMEQFLETFDTDADGSLTQEEVDATRAARLAEFDTDGDGALTLEEFQALWLDAMRERMVDRFQSHDDDGDGLVTGAEFGERYANIVSRRDQNGDGVLNIDDLRRGQGRNAPAPAE